ncbi:helix-turn-helix domain-containing protein [Nocardia higoensis]|uniref:Helix-turn-helix domain-containing protein n=1 Tax=Nocardia higoensis TaxID=228599 RepID=A0ABS0DBM8_9NOCA|nr:helix-turn-helix transcriptional regulator [Nocardia higoensis]MBF6355876.1 helix-turn-helix domain-containing protein [Nocardia higoensis]
MANRTDLAAFLRARRADLRPSDVGLPQTGPRRTPGLRRQEVAQLAGISVEYYVRLEQARGPRPSAQVIGALARALMLTADERNYLFRTAGHQPPVVAGPNRTVSVAVRAILDGLTAMPAYVADASYDILAWNAMAVFFISDLTDTPASDRNMVRWAFRRRADDPSWSDPETLQFARTTVADLRAAYARYPGNSGLGALVTELLGTSTRFAQMWASQDVAERRNHRKRVTHPEYGVLDFECQVLHLPDSDQRIIIYCADPGSPTEAIFRELAEGTRPLVPLSLPGSARRV